MEAARKKNGLDEDGMRGWSEWKVVVVILMVSRENRAQITELFLVVPVFACLTVLPAPRQNCTEQRTMPTPALP